MAEAVAAPAPATPAAPAASKTAAPASTSVNTQAAPAAPDAKDGKAVAAAVADAKAAGEYIVEIKVGGKVQAFDIRKPDDRAKLTRAAQFGEAGQKGLQEAAEIRKQGEALVKLLKDNPRAALSHPSIGVDVLKFAEQIILEQIESEKMTPEQRELKAAKSKLQEFEDKERERQEGVTKAEQEKMQEALGQKLDQEFAQVLQTSGLPKTPRTLARLAYYMDKALEAEIDCTPADVVHLVREDYQREISELFGQTDGDALLSLLGEDVAGKIRKTDLARVAAPVARPVSKTVIPGLEPKTDDGLSQRERRRRANAELDKLWLGK